MPRSEARKVRWETWLALFLALTGGFVDAIGYMVLFKLFVGHMSGNSIDMMVQLGQQHWGEAFHRAFPIPVFVAGVVVGAALSEALFRRGVRSQFAATFLLEAVLLVLFVAFGAACYHDGGVRPDSETAFYLLAALPSLAMGVQNSALRHVGGIGVRTTYITGMLTNFAEEAVEYGYWFGGHLRGRRVEVLLALSPRRPSFRRMGLFLGVWTTFIVGGVVGALTELRWGLFPLLAPAVALVGVAVRDLIRPIAPPRPPRTKPEWKP